MGHSACLIERNKLLIFGGQEKNGNLLNDMHILDVNLMLWFQPYVVGSSPSERCFHSCTVIAQDSILLLGGLGNSEPFICSFFPKDPVTEFIRKVPARKSSKEVELEKKPWPKEKSQSMEELKHSSSFIEKRTDSAGAQFQEFTELKGNQSIKVPLLASAPSFSSSSEASDISLASFPLGGSCLYLGREATETIPLSSYNPMLLGMKNRNLLNLGEYSESLFQWKEDLLDRRESALEEREKELHIKERELANKELSLKCLEEKLQRKWDKKKKNEEEKKKEKK
eukprot:CAMPEP_0174268102 /NCGR_PEP_ID=MMETSP0439-20130205/36129_1 /TAXON_ID=0 /ORGANISM="Stereomyxa ramosa, Strain Chinc5" /LENGTH=282 /DNA_ID=CAMNT_0015356065 /DNA_START=469 /DNA_END=1317 /DNA_ORIENTATION=+